MFQFISILKMQLMKCKLRRGYPVNTIFALSSLKRDTVDPTLSGLPLETFSCGSIACHGSSNLRTAIAGSPFNKSQQTS